MGGGLAGSDGHETVTEFFAMGGYGVYVWTAYGLSLLALVTVGAWPLLAMRALVRGMKRRRATGTSVAPPAAEVP